MISVTLCSHAPLFLLPVQIGEWEVETPVPGCLGHQEHILPHHCMEKAFPYKHALANTLLFWFAVFFLELPPSPSKTLKILGYYKASQSVVHPIKARHCYLGPAACA